MRIGDDAAGRHGGPVSGRALVPVAATPGSGPDADPRGGRAPGRALVALAPVPRAETAAPASGRFAAAVAAQLIAGRDDLPQARARRRAAPGEAARAYAEALRRVERLPAGTMLARAL